MGGLADILDYFNDVDDDEALRLQEQSIAIVCRVEGSSSYNVVAHECKLGKSYIKRAWRAHVVNDQDRELFNAELSLSHFHEAARISRAINRTDMDELCRCSIATLEERVQ